MYMYTHSYRNYEHIQQELRETSFLHGQLTERRGEELHNTIRIIAIANV